MFAVLALLSFNAAAGVPTVPSIQPAGAVLVPLIQLRMAGGMPGPGGLGSLEIFVTTNGEVHVQEYRYTPDMRGSVQNSYQLADLPPVELLKTVELVSQLEGGELEESTQPPCMDAPGTQYSIFKNGTLRTIFAISNCREEELKDVNQRWVAKKVKMQLDALLQLTYSKR